MDPRFQSSFIPKKPIIAQQSSIPSTINLFALIATVIFMLALASSAGAFFYKKLLVTQIEDRETSFVRAQEAFEPALIQQVTRLDSRIETSKKLLASHVAVTPLFEAISRDTLRTVRFRDFSYTYASPNQITLQMKGQAQNYASVALQSDMFNSRTYLKNLAIGDMTLEPSGTVAFSVSATVDASLLSYSRSLSRTSSQQSPAAATPPASVATTSQAQTQQ